MAITTLYNRILSLASDPQQTRWVLPLLLLVDAVLTALIVWKVPYTEIDFATYMEQVRVYLEGTRDYTFIEGPTGPCVYPAAHLYLYSLIFYIIGDKEGVYTAQWIFAGVYLISLGVAGRVYWNCKVPPYILPLLMLSKRLHSIFVLRLFNDCFASLFLFISILLFQRKEWNLGSAVFSIGVGVKMSLLLALPGILVVMAQAMSITGLIIQIVIMGTIQVQLGLPFIINNQPAYVSRAFNFSRQFLFEWTVNWRFIKEELFLSKEFSLILLAAHAIFLLWFTLTRWIRPSNIPVPHFLRNLLFGFPSGRARYASVHLTPVFISTTILTSVAIGMLFARSLHYQFYAYLAWTTPLLLWQSGLHPVLIYVMWAIQEWSWNVFPSTDTSSKAVVASLAVQVLGVWFGTGKGILRTLRMRKGEKQVHEE